LLADTMVRATGWNDVLEVNFPAPTDAQNQCQSSLVFDPADSPVNRRHDTSRILRISNHEGLRQLLAHCASLYKYNRATQSVGKD
jgi:hypothetical protein